MFWRTDQKSDGRGK